MSATRQVKSNSYYEMMQTFASAASNKTSSALISIQKSPVTKLMIGSALTVGHALAEEVTKINDILAYHNTNTNLTTHYNYAATMQGIKFTELYDVKDQLRSICNMTLAYTTETIQCEIAGIPEYSKVLYQDIMDNVEYIGEYTADFLRNCNEAVDETAQQCAKGVLEENLAEKPMNTAALVVMLTGGALFATGMVGGIIYHHMKTKNISLLESHEAQPLARENENRSNYGTDTDLEAGITHTSNESCFSASKRLVTSLFSGWRTTPPIETNDHAEEFRLV